MLNYPFPYDSTSVQSAYAKYTRALHAAVNHTHKKDFDDYYRKYVLSKKELQEVLSEKDYRYFSFQIWQEGIARYAEYALLKFLIGKDIIKNSHFRNEYVKLFANIRETELHHLNHLSLKELRRVHFYSSGFAEGLLLDRIDPSWRDQYKKKLFSIDHLHLPRK